MAQKYQQIPELSHTALDNVVLYNSDWCAGVNKIDCAEDKVSVGEGCWL